MKLIMIGCGGMGTYQAKKFIELGVELVGAIDHNDEHRSHFCSTYAVSEAYADVDQLSRFQGRADAVSCCLPDAFHHQCCLLALQLGFAVFCEKPLCTSLEQARQLDEASFDVPFMVNFSKRSIPALAAAQEVLNTGKLGALMRVEAMYLQSWQQSHVWGDPEQDFRWKWRLLPSYNRGGCLADLGSHLLDLLLLLFGSVCFVKTLSTVTDQVLIEYQGELKVGNDVPCILGCSYADKQSDDSLQLKVVGTQATLEMNTSLDRKQILVAPGGGESYHVSAPAPPSTYQTFVRWVDLDQAGRPNLEDGLSVQGLLEEMIG
ncbi:MAG: Gfo/Idh/MocA family oxidoreductase [Sphaerochaeta sp.]|jgi:predicted dehydrogenase|nr:Gfo/Idh/MocA family oxidoreductase [Sphaerochaeta sp.]